MTDQALCAICAVDAPRPVICLRCEQRLRRDLDTVGKLRHDLDPRPGRGRSSGKAPGKPGSRPPANITVLSATDMRSGLAGHGDPDDVPTVDATLLGWGRITVEERMLTLALRDVFDVLRILNLSHDWWTRHPAVDEYAAELHTCAIALRRMCGDVGEPVVGKCPAALDDGSDCGGPLRLEYGGPLRDDLDAAAPTGLVCGRCSGRWDTDAATMVQFLRVVQPKATFPVPRDWAVREYNLSHALLRLWVHRGYVKGYGDGQVDLVSLLARLNGDTQAG